MITLASGERVRRARHCRRHAGLVGGIDAGDRIDHELWPRLCASIEYASSATAVYALRRDQVRNPLNGTGYVVPYRERRALMAATWVSSKWPHRAPADHVLLRGFVGGRSRSRHSRAGRRGARSLRLLGFGRPAWHRWGADMTRVYRWPRASAQYNVGHARHSARHRRSTTSSSRGSF